MFFTKTSDSLDIAKSSNILPNVKSGWTFEIQIIKTQKIISLASNYVAKILPQGL